MDYPIKTDGIYVSKLIFDEISEQTVDADFGLPDYCPDIQKILKCQLEPHIESRNIIGDRIEIEGSGTVRIIYIDAIKNSVRCTEQSYPFSISSNLKDTPQSAVIQTETKVNYLNCRALSPRRLNIHGAFNIGIKVTDKHEMHTCTNIKGDDIEQKKQTVNYSYLEGLGQQQFSVTETLETGQNRLAIQSVVRSDIRALCSECKPVLGKVMYKGDLLVKLMYLSDLDNGKIETMEYAIPFSQVIDVSGVTENSDCVVKTEVMNYNVALRTEIGFDDPLPVLSAKLCVTVFSYEKRDTMAITDCYSTKYFLDTECESYTFPMLTADLKETVVDKSIVEFTDTSISKVIDVWCEKGGVICSQNAGKTTLDGKYNICVLAVDKEGSVVYTERTMEYSHSLKDIPEISNLRFYGSTECISSGFRFSTEKRIEVRTELLIKGELYDDFTILAVSGAKADEGKKRSNNNFPLILYFAKSGENVWEIAKSHCTGVEQIRQENELIEDILTSDTMIMIPS